MMTIKLNNGTFSVEVPPSDKTYSLRVCYGSKCLFYLLRDYNEFPFQYGPGTYTVQLCDQISDTKYKVLEIKKISPKLLTIYSPFLQPNQYVDYRGLELPQLNGKNIDEYMTRIYTYDFIRAVKIAKQRNILPDIKHVLTKKRGVCYDLAAFAAAVCRYNNIPAKMIIGYADGAYHAQIEYLDNNKWIRYDPAAKRLRKIVKNYTIERFY